MFSKNGVALVVLVLSLFGVNVSETEVLTTISVIAQIVSIVMMGYNQITRSDTAFFIFKK